MSTDFHNFFTDIFTRKLGEIAGNSMTNCFLAHNLQMKMQIKLAYFQHHAEKDALSIPLLRLEQFWPNAFHDATTVNASDQKQTGLHDAPRSQNSWPSCEERRALFSALGQNIRR